jgi:hypothetical protein
MKRSLTIAVIAAAGFLIGAPAAVAAPSGSATISTSRPTHVSQSGYAALGDSYSAGEGLAPYLPGSDTQGNTCHRSAGAYSEKGERGTRPEGKFRETETVGPDARRADPSAGPPLLAYLRSPSRPMTAW